MPSSPRTSTCCLKKSSTLRPDIRKLQLGSVASPRDSITRNCWTCSAEEHLLDRQDPNTQIAPLASILIVDDTPANLQVLAGMLKDRGYKVRPVPSGKLALSAAQRDPPDLILLDINMPNMNGYEVCEHLKADVNLKGIPIIFISALTEPLDKVKAFSIGGVDYLTKPFQMEELHARVETHLKLRRLQIDLEDYSRNLELARARIDLDLKLARGVQRSFLPQRMVQIPGYE